jgi:hypothetical protein
MAKVNRVEKSNNDSSGPSLLAWVYVLIVLLLTGIAALSYWLINGFPWHWL